MAFCKFGYFKLVSRISRTVFELGLEINQLIAHDKLIACLLKKTVEKNPSNFSGVMALYKVGHFIFFSRISQNLFKLGT